MVPRGIRSIGKVPEFEQCAKHAKCIRGLFLECPFDESDFRRISLLPAESAAPCLGKPSTREAFGVQTAASVAKKSVTINLIS